MTGFYVNEARSDAGGVGVLAQRRGLAAAEERVFRRLVRNVRLPGFRKGRVPRKIFEQTYGKDAVTNEAVEKSCRMCTRRRCENTISSRSNRRKSKSSSRTGGRPTKLKATVEVRPSIELGAYKGVSMSRPPVTVGDADVERSLEALARERATLVPVEREARLGDIATLDYEGTIDGTPFEGGARRSDGRARRGTVHSRFRCRIAGMRPGETKASNANFPTNTRGGTRGKRCGVSGEPDGAQGARIPALDEEVREGRIGEPER